jgi:amino acid permease
MPVLRAYYESIGKLDVEYFFKPFDLKMVTSFLSILFSYNLQIYALDIKKELLFPSKIRLNKINIFATCYEYLICTMVGFFSYICLGDNYITKIIVLRNSIEGQENSFFEIYLIVFRIIFFLLLIISMPIFNPSVRAYFYELFELKKWE